MPVPFNFPVVPIKSPDVTKFQQSIAPATSNALDIGTNALRFRDLYMGGTVYASNLQVVGEVLTVNSVTSNSDQMFITNLGTGPALVVKQAGAQAVAEFIDAESGSALFIGNNGNVGIGTTVGMEKIQVEGNIALSGGNRYVGTRTNHELSLRTNNVDRLNIDIGGNVGIGTAIEIERLHVEGNVALSGADRFIGTTTNHGLNLRTNNTNRITVLSNGNVGIGTTVARSQLEVNGAILPSACNVYDLGSRTLRWRDLYLSGSTIDLEGIQITSRNNELVLPNLTLNGPVVNGFNAKDIRSYNYAGQVNLASVDSDLRGFQGGFTDGRFGYFVPYNNGTHFGKVARVNISPLNTSQL